MKVSVIIPVYNAEKHIKQCLDSIINQSLKELEIICVDDCSIDNSINIIKDFSKKDDRVKYFSMPENSGAGPARNKGIEHATGKYISFIDSDDSIIDNRAYEMLYKFAIKNDADVVSANLITYNNGEVEENYFVNEIKVTSQISPQDYGIPWYFQKNLYRRQFLIEKNIKFPNYARGQDPVFLAEVLKNVDAVYRLPVDFYAYNYACTDSPYKIASEKAELDYIKHFKNVYGLLSSSKFEKVRREYEDIMYKFFIDHTFAFPSKSLEKNITAVFGEKSEVALIYKFKCDLWEKENEIWTLNSALSEKENKIHELNLALSEKENKIQKLNSTLSEKENKIQEVMSSNSWKLTKPLRKLRKPLKDLEK